MATGFIKVRWQIQTGARQSKIKLQLFSERGLTQNKCCQGGKLDEGSGDTLTHIHGCPNNAHEIPDRSKLKVDSDKALKIAMSQPRLKALTLTASKLTLEHGDEGPVWKVQLWAAKLENLKGNADVGVVVISATNGSVAKADLHPNKVD